MKAKFSLGQVVYTPAAMRAAGMLEILRAIGRHQLGDWGDVDPEDRATNASGLLRGGRLMSVYKLNEEVTLWVITEHDRSSTTALLPSDY